MSIGAWDDRGNGGPVAVLKKTPSAGPTNVSFTARLWDFIPTTIDGVNPGLLDSGMWAIADWGTKPKMVIVNFFHWNSEYACQGIRCTSLVTGVDSSNWNWPISESMMYPGAEITSFDIEDLPTLCSISQTRLTTINQQVDYDFDLQDLFQCASDLGLWSEPLDNYSNVPVGGVSWKTEGYGHDGAVWVSVHDMQITY